jgi:hypothetical protein
MTGYRIPHLDTIAWIILGLGAGLILRTGRDEISRISRRP